MKVSPGRRRWRSRNLYWRGRVVRSTQRLRWHLSEFERQRVQMTGHSSPGRRPAGGSTARSNRRAEGRGVPGHRQSGRRPGSAGLKPSSEHEDLRSRDAVKAPRFSAARLPRFTASVGDHYAHSDSRHAAPSRKAGGRCRPETRSRQGWRRTGHGVPWRVSVASWDRIVVISQESRRHAPSPTYSGGRESFPG